MNKEIQTPAGYEVTNKANGQKKYYATSRQALMAMDRQDKAYGASICTRRAIWDNAEWERIKK